ncbi:MAG: hypothetical protein Q7T21_05250 [Gallionella sp.]|nr:hypothetical protein [Gallionella sp.]
MQYLIPAILTVIGGLILWVIQRERLSLTYEIVKSEVFPRENTSGMYFVCTLRNTGNRPIEKISYKLCVNDGSIESVKFSNSKLIQLLTQDQAILEGEIPLLNPKEELGAVVTIANASSHSTSSLEARAIGATARKESNQPMPEYISGIAIAVTLGVAASSVFTVWTSYRQSEVSRLFENIGGAENIAKSVKESEMSLDELKKQTSELRKEADKQEKEYKDGLPDREEIVFAILNKSGIGYILPALLTTGDELPFWKTGLYLMHSYLGNKKNAKKYVDALDQLSRVEQISPSSKGFLLYLAGKIEQDSGNNKSAIEYMEKCKKAAPLMYEHLMSQDPAYDLRSIERAVAGIKPKLTH